MNNIFGMDIETSSAAPLQKVGAAAYIDHPSTVCLMVAWHPIGDPSPARLWCYGDPVPGEIVNHVRGGGLFTGWNVLNFDRRGWARLLVPLGFPPVSDDNWRDSIHLAAAANLPRSLEGCAKAVGLGFNTDLKDHKRIKRITDQTQTPLTLMPNGRLVFGDRVSGLLKPAQIAALDDDMAWLMARCPQDVVMEEGVLLRLPPWPDMKPWLAMPAIDRRINDRGVLLDVPLVEGMAHAAAKETARLDEEMDKLTKGRVPKTTNVEKLKLWLLERNVPVPLKATKAEQELLEFDGDDSLNPESEAEKGSRYRLRKNDIANLLALPDSEVPEDCRIALYMRAEAAKASVRKLRAMLDAAGSDGRLLGMLTLMGAQAVGRFSSGRAQLHNMVRDAFAKDYENIAEKNGLHPKHDKGQVKQLANLMLATAIQIGRTGDPDLIRMMYEAPRKDLQGRVRIEGVLPWVSRMMRRTIAAPAGRVLVNGDFANIQARIPVWLAGQQETVDAFARGEDLYRVQAAPVYGLPPDQLSSEQRQIGKVMRLFLGFGAGVNAFIPAAMIYGISIPQETGRQFVDIFRATNKPLVEFWDNNLLAASYAIIYPGQEFWVPPTNYVSWFMEPANGDRADCLCMRLPSRRLLRYWEPRLEQGYWPDGGAKSTLDLTVLVVKGGHRFRRTLWRGLAMQNTTAAIEADLLCVALNNMEDAGIPVDLHVHDSISGEADEDNAEQIMPVFKQCMISMPSWANGLPVAADCDISARFG